MEDDEFETPDAKKGKISETYKLRCAFSGHSDEIRAVTNAETTGGKLCIVSGSRDKTARVWVPRNDGNFQVFQACEGHTKLVSCVCFIQPTGRYPTGLVFTGGHDHTILGYELGNVTPLFKLTGHSGLVGCIAGTIGPVIVSGSWDKTAKVWSKEQNVATLEGHELPIAAVAMIDGSQNKILTGSVDKTVRLWTNSITTRTFKGHTECIRSIAVINPNRFLSASNDGTVRLWNIEDGKTLHIYCGHTHFISSVAVLPNTKDFVSVSRDRTLRIWKDKNCEQVISLPASRTWSVACLKNGDVITGNSDGVIRIFTSCEDRKADPAILQGFDEEVSRFELEKQNQSDGEKILHEGREYDYVFHVQLDENMSFKLPYDITEDPWDAASVFIYKHKLNRWFLEQVADFIIDNTQDKCFGKWGPGNSKSFRVPVRNLFHNAANFSTHFPTKMFLRFAQNPSYKSLSTKLTEFVRRWDTFSIDEEHVETLMDIAISKKWDLNSGKIVRGALDLPSQNIYPVLDLIRIGVLAPAVADSLNRSFDLNSLSKIACGDSPKDLDKNPRNQMLMLKILCNCFGVLTNYLMEHRIEITNRLLHHLGNDKHNQIAAATLFLNYSIAVTENLDSYTVETKTEILKIGCNLSKFLVEPEPLHRLFIGIGNIIHENEKMIGVFRRLGGVYLANRWSEYSECDKNKACAQQILKYLGCSD